VTVWLAIDDADEENSAMQVLPGSHRAGALKHGQSGASENNVLWLTADLAQAKDIEPVSMNMRAGEISLHSDMLVHGSQPNRSNRRRCGLTIRYAATEVRSGQGTQAIICRGSDPSGHWQHIPRPKGLIG
jgi:non-haem Fe2+, alpha-ketoglutarate-dependent halogenase